MTAHPNKYGHTQDTSPRYRLWPLWYLAFVAITSINTDKGGAFAMQDFAKSVGGIYARFILRDFVGKVIPGYLLLLSVCGTFE